MLEPNALEGSDQFLDGRTVGYEADIFQWKFIIDLFDDKFWIPLHSEPLNSHFKEDEPYN